MAKKKDIAETARGIVEQVIGEKLDGEPLDEVVLNSHKSEKSSKGGKARAEKLTRQQRKEIAKKAAAKRWGKN